jgi:hypothetical protein
MRNEKLLRAISALRFFEVSNYKTELFEGKEIAVNYPKRITDIEWPKYKAQFVKERLAKYEASKPLAVVIEREAKAAEVVATELGTPEARYLAKLYVDELSQLGNLPDTVNPLDNSSNIEFSHEKLTAIQKAFQSAVSPKMVKELREGLEAARQKWQTEYYGTFKSIEAFLKSEGKVLPKNEMQFLKWACDNIPGFASGTFRTLQFEQEYFWQFAEHRAREIRAITAKEQREPRPQAKPKYSLRQVALMLVYNGESFVSADHKESRERLDAIAAKNGFTSDTSGVQLYKKHFHNLTNPTDRTGAAKPAKMKKDIEGILDQLTPAGRILAEADLQALTLKTS